MPDKPVQPRDIPLTGKLITALDGLVVGENFTTLKNMRYVATHLRAISGMSKINSTALTTYLKTRSGHHYTKVLPAVESHVLVQAENAGETASQVLDNTAAIPATSDFSATAIHTDDASAGLGRFSDAPQSQVAYCNGKESLIWGGDESRCAGFINYDPAGSFSFDFTEEIQNLQTDAGNIATITPGPATTIGSIYVGSLIPLRGFKVYVGTANTGVGTMAVSYWTGSAWAAVSTLVDGTAAGGVSLAATGSVTFDDTETIAKIKEIDSKIVYWYKVVIDVVDATTTISHVSVDYSMQTVRDIWDGIFRPVISVQKEAGVSGLYSDNTTNVFEEDYIPATASTYMDMAAFAAAHAIYIGFTEKQTGLYVVMPQQNTTNSVMTISYWTGAAWAAVSGLDDGTSSGTATLSKSATITWDATAAGAEFTTDLARETPLFYYKLTVSVQLSATLVKIDRISGIPRQKEMPGYKFPMIAQDRLWLCGRDDQDKNAAICSSRDTFSIFNGDDSLTIFFGDDTELTAGTSLYSQYGSNLYDTMIFCKAHETWVVTGAGPASWVKFPASKETGCVAPLTMATANVTAKVVDGTNRHVAFWQAADGMYVFDGRIFTRISDDVENFFDPNAADTMNPAMAAKSVGFYDEIWREYHWLFASGTSTSLNREFVYTVKFGKWYEVDRGTGNDLQFGIPIRDTTGNNYNYGFIDTGYMERLENGTTFDGDDMTFTLKFGDIMLGGSPNIESQVDQVILSTVAKTSTANKITMTRYADTVALTTTFEFDPVHATKRVVHLTKDQDRTKKITNSFKFEMTTNNEAIGFEPMVISLQGKNIRLKKDG